MRNEQFINGEYYHVYNRGVDRRIIYRSEKDFDRFVEGLRVFNTTLDACTPISFLKRCQNNYPFEQQLVRIHQFTLMSNHFHLLLKQVRDSGISDFLQRLCTSHTKFINKEENRTGHLFESAFKVKRIDSQSYLEYITRYIHLNPLDMIGIDWKSKGVKDTRTALEFLVSYRWSSFYYYFNKIETPVLDLNLLESLFPSRDAHVEFMFDFQPSQQDENNDFL